MTGWTLTEARGISPDGLKIVGMGFNPDGRTEAWVADLTGAGPTIIPVPAAAWLWCGLLGGVGAVGTIRRKLSRG